MDKVFIEELRVDTVIGVYDFEKLKTQPLFFDVEMVTDIRAAAASDSVELAVDYAKVSDLISDFCEKHQFDLLEALVSRLADEILAAYPISAIRIKVRKPEAVPMAKSVGVQIYRER